MASLQFKWSAGALREAKALIWDRRYRFAFGVGLLFVNRIAGLVLPASSTYFLDRIIGGRRGDLLLYIALVIAAATLVQIASNVLLTRTLVVASHRAIAELRRRVEAHVMRLPVRYFDTTASGIISSRIMHDTELVRDLIGTGLVHFAGNTISATLALAYLFYLNAWLSALLVVVVMMFAWAISRSFARLRPLYEENAEIRAGIHARLHESLGGIRVVKTYAAEQREARVFTIGVYRLFRNLAASTVYWSGNSVLSGLATGVVGVLLILVGGRAILEGSMTAGQFLTYVMFVALVVGPVEHVVNMGPSVSEALCALERIHGVLSQPSELADDATRKPVAPIIGDIRFEHVSFEYDAGVPALREVSLVARAGTTVALVGASGAGKSTMINLVMGFVRPTDGRVLIDGHDLAGLRLREYRAQLGVVLQDTFLFDGTIAENIRYGRPGATDEAVLRASRIAHADEFIQRTPDRYETVVGERGVKLSGGQRQRIAIARAVLVDPRILVLDEATSSLDSETEAAIQDALRSLRIGRTTFVIAHRLSTVRSADQIVVLDHGRILATGTHAQLLSANDIYRAFYARQYAIDAERLVNAGEEFATET